MTLMAKNSPVTIIKQAKVADISESQLPLCVERLGIAMCLPY